MDSAVGTAAGLAVKAAAAVVKWEGSKYVKDSSGELKEADLKDLTHLVGTEGWVLSNRGNPKDVPAAYLTVLRYVRQRVGSLSMTGPSPLRYKILHTEPSTPCRRRSRLPCSESPRRATPALFSSLQRGRTRSPLAD